MHCGGAVSVEAVFSFPFVSIEVSRDRTEGRGFDSAAAEVVSDVGGAGGGWESVSPCSVLIKSLFIINNN